MITDATLWTGGLNHKLQRDGQFPYGRDDFGSLTMLAELTVALPDHDLGNVNDYRRTLDLAQGLISTSYQHLRGVTYRRQIFASGPDDDAIVLDFSQQAAAPTPVPSPSWAPTASPPPPTARAATRRSAPPWPTA